MDAEAGVYSEDSGGNLRRRRKLRHLSVKHDKDNVYVSPHEIKIIIVIFAIVAISGLSLIAYLCKGNNASRLIQHFSKIYYEHYNAIVHNNSDYCDQKINIDAIMKRLNQGHILHQERALLNLSNALRNESELNFVALVGPAGVGKSLVAQSLAEQWPWPENVHTFMWNANKVTELKFQIFRNIFNALSECGTNLFIIDNLKPYDIRLVYEMNGMFIQQKQDENLKTVKAILIYVFKLNRMEDEVTYGRHYDMLQKLPYTRVINFATFGVAQLKNCIEREARMENVLISEEHFKDIVNTINPDMSGCKNVRAKVLVYGKRIENDQNDENH